MDKFPDNFNDAYLTEARQKLKIEQLSRQEKLLQDTREQIYNQIERDVKTSDETIIELPDDLTFESKKKLITELNKNFSQIEYLFVVEYADIEKFIPLNRETPQVSCNYKIKFPKV